MKISMIAAMSRNRVIGKENDLPWHLPDDFHYFKESTSGRHVIMGRKNYESLPHRFRPLPNRINIVMTRNQSFQAEGVIVAKNLDAALKVAKDNNEQEAFIIGGGQIYALGLEYADCIYLTEVDADIDGDTYFPKFDASRWTEVERSHHPIDDRHTYAFDFVTYSKNRD
ncbi:MAG: dihydrofolate reductase [Cyclobacteriaceae bacterium]